MSGSLIHGSFTAHSRGCLAAHLQLTRQVLLDGARYDDAAASELAAADAPPGGAALCNGLEEIFDFQLLRMTDDPETLLEEDGGTQAATK